MGKGRLSEKYGQAVRPRREPREMAGDRAFRKSCLDGDRGSRSERIHERLSGRALPEKLQGSGYLRGNARHSHVNAGRLGSWAEKGKTGTRYAAGLSG